MECIQCFFGWFFWLKYGLITIMLDIRGTQWLIIFQQLLLESWKI